MNKINEVQTSESGIFNQSQLKKIKRKGKPNIFCDRLKKNLTKYLFDFFYMRELSNFCSANIFLYNCFLEYEISTWKSEMFNLIDIFNLDIKNINEEIDDSLLTCIQKKRLYPMKDLLGNYIKIDKEGINIISQVYYDPNMQTQIEKLKDNKRTIVNHFNLTAFEMLEMNEDIEEINPSTLKTPWKVVHSDNAYTPGNIIFLEEKSTLDFGFSFHHVIKGNYKFYLHQDILNMRNANLRLTISINDRVVFEINNFPSKKILEQFKKNKNDDENVIDLKDTYICDINEHMFDCVKNELKNSIGKEIDNQKNYNSEGSTDSSNSQNINLQKNIKSNDSQFRQYTVRISFTNHHLFWKAGWYLDGGRLVRTIYKIK